MEIDEVEISIDTIVDLADQLTQESLSRFQLDFAGTIYRSASYLKSALEFDYIKSFLTTGAISDEVRLNIRHELDNPTGTIDGMAELFLRGIVGSLTDEQQELIREIKQLNLRLSEWMGKPTL